MIYLLLSSGLKFTVMVDVCVDEAPRSGASSPGGMWVEDDTYIPRMDGTLPRLR